VKQRQLLFDAVNTIAFENYIGPWSPIGQHPRASLASICECVFGATLRGYQHTGRSPVKIERKIKLLTPESTDQRALRRKRFSGYKKMFDEWMSFQNRSSKWLDHD
jgi:hypothetical protein